MALNVGDKFRVVRTDSELKQKYVGEVFTVSEVNPNSWFKDKLHYDVKEPCIFIFFDFEIEPVATSPIKRVIYNDPATIILWNDGTKTIAKCQEGDTYDREKGFVIAYLKKMIGNTTFRNEFEKWCDVFDEKKPSNDPLTIEQLMKMDGQKVWLSCIDLDGEIFDNKYCGWYTVNAKNQRLIDTRPPHWYYRICMEGALYGFRAYRECPIKK